MVVCFWTFACIAQITTSRMEQFVLQYKQLSNTKENHIEQLRRFYAGIAYQTAWTKQKDSINLSILLNNISASASLGLRTDDYEFKLIEDFSNGNIHLMNEDDSLELDIRITVAAIQFYTDLAYGNIKPYFGYDGLTYKPGCFDIPALLTEHILNNSLSSVNIALSSRLAEINAIENKLKRLYAVMAENNFREVYITSGIISESNKPLLLKLYQLGIIDSINTGFKGISLRQKINEARQLFNLPVTTILSAHLINQLNIPVYVRAQQLCLSVNYYRWLYCFAQRESIIVVNIPAAYLKVYRNNETVLEMRMIVGKKSTPTPTLTSRIEKVVLYPYWYVPHSIATKELLPVIKRDLNFLDHANYQALNSAGSIVNPHSVNWQALSTKYFPYVLRQGTGCDNALGILKLDFYSPFGVYLHDSPTNILFPLNERFFSHGCMRMEKPMELGLMVLKDNHVAIDTIQQKGNLINQSPINVTADDRMPVIVWYNPAGTDSSGHVQFYEDVYEKFNWAKK